MVLIVNAALYAYLIAKRSSARLCSYLTPGIENAAVPSSRFRILALNALNVDRSSG